MVRLGAWAGEPMDAWIRNGAFIITFLMWAVYMVILFRRGVDIDLAWFGVPGVAYAVFNPTWRRAKKPDEEQP